MKRKRLLDIINKYYEELDGTRKVLVQNYSVEDIHRFRQLCKKLKAFLYLLSVRWGRDKLQISRKLSIVYQLCGTIRDFQLQQLHYTAEGKNRPVPEYRKMLERRIDKSIRPLSKLLSKKLLEQSKRKNLKAVKGDYKLKDYLKFYGKKWDYIKGVINSETISDKDLHRIRKEIKRLHYVSTYFCDKRPSIDYRELAERLGDYQDQCNAIRLLRPKTFRHGNAGAKKWLTQEREDRLGKKAILKRSLIDELRTALA